MTRADLEIRLRRRVTLLDDLALDTAPTLDWSSLTGCNLTDARDCVQIYGRLLLTPLLLNGMLPDGKCTCGREHPVKIRPDGSQSSSAGKHPVAKGWQFMQVDLDAMDRQLQRQPFLNVGLRMGKQPDGSFLVAIDVDGPMSLLAELERKAGPLPATLTAKTPRGFHLIYRWPEGKQHPKNQTSLVAGHVDVRSAGGQIAVVPSRHFSGGRYQWIRAIEPAVLP
jgi:hypothetical protein